MIIWRDNTQRPWHSWFAWYPVIITGVGLIWLERVERCYGGWHGSWIYRAIADTPA